MSLITAFTLLPALALGMTYDEAKTSILNEVNGFKGTVGIGKSLCESHTCCELADSKCDLSGMKQDETTLVLPGGESRCIYDTSTPYAAQVIPGDTDKLMVFFQGGKHTCLINQAISLCVCKHGCNFSSTLICDYRRSLLG